MSFGTLYKDELIFPGSASNVGIGAREQELSGLIYFSTGYPELAFLPEADRLLALDELRLFTTWAVMTARNRTPAP